MLKLPRTLHIEGSRMPAGKTDPEAVELSKLSDEFLVVEEKVDGTGVSIFFDDQAVLQVYHRGSPATGKEFTKLHAWAASRQDKLFDLLGDRYIMFGEWMYNKHTIYYDTLPDYFLESDMYDKVNNIWLGHNARMELLSGQNIFSVPVLDSLVLKHTLVKNKIYRLTAMIRKPRYQSEHWPEAMWKMCEKHNLSLEKAIEQTEKSSLMEGLYIKSEDNNQVIGRYKYVRYEFVNFIIQSNSHIRDREIVPNSLRGG